MLLVRHLSFQGHCLDQAILSTNIAHFYHYAVAMWVILYHPNVCSILVKNQSKHSVRHKLTSVLTGITSSNSHLLDPVTVFSSLPTALTAWIKSTVTCVTTSPILLQT